MLQVPPLPAQPSAPSDNRARHLRRAVERAVENVQPGMVLGFGGGMPVVLVLRRLAALLDARALSDLSVVACAPHVREEAARAGLPLVDLVDVAAIDLLFDGADEVDPDLDRVHSASASLLRRRILSQASRREILVIDDSRRAPRLGTRVAIPVEITPFACDLQVAWLESLGATVQPRKLGGAPLQNEDGNSVYDCRFPALEDAPALAARLDARAGIAAHGLFTGLNAEVISAGDAGVRHLVRRRG